MSKKAYREQKKHSSLMIPYSFLYGVMPDYYPSIGQHCHSEFEMLVFRKGKCRFQINDSFFTAQTGDIVIVQPDVIHGAEPLGDKSVAYDIVLFEPRLMTGGVKDRAYQELWLPIISGEMVVEPLIKSDHPYYSELRRTADHAITCVRMPTIPNELLLRSALHELFFLLLDSGNIHTREQQLSDAEGVLYPVTEYIKEHYMQSLTVEALADIVHLSKSYFMGLFRKTYGMPVLVYVHNVRIEAVCELLQNTSDSITEIAVKCGYPSIANFNRHFQKKVGMTPGVYRKSTRRSSGDKRMKIAPKLSIYDMKLTVAYRQLVSKAKHRGHSADEVCEIVCWLTGYTKQQFEELLDADVAYQILFENAPQINPEAKKLKGIINGMRVEMIEEPLMQQICWLEKLVDDMVRGKPVDLTLNNL